MKEKLLHATKQLRVSLAFVAKIEIYVHTSEGG
jgi:hypothetical protein